MRVLAYILVIYSLLSSLCVIAQDQVEQIRLDVPLPPTIEGPYDPKNNASYSEEWVLPLMKGVMKGQMLHVQKIVTHPNPWHTCYKVTCENAFNHHCPSPTDPWGNSLEFCYPAVVVTGMPKCGTSAMYDLLKRYSGSIVMFEKENCPYTRRRSHWEYFHTLPKASEVKAGQLVIDGCVDTHKNLMLRKLLRRPETLFIVMVRNYADMIWSSYNFWCKREYDGYDCDNTRWVKPHYNRSATLFHEIIAKDSKNQLEQKTGSPFHGAQVRPCGNAEGYYYEYLNYMLWKDLGGQFSTRRTDSNHTMLLANEALEKDPMEMWSRVAAYFGIPTSNSGGAGGEYTFKIGDFSEYRTNTQSMKGGTEHVLVKDYKPGKFAISNYEAMFQDTREMLDRCWKTDCVYISKLTKHIYAACADKFPNGI